MNIGRWVQNGAVTQTVPFGYTYGGSAWPSEHVSCSYGPLRNRRRVIRGSIAAESSTLVGKGRCDQDSSHLV